MTVLLLTAAAAAAPERVASLLAIGPRSVAPPSCAKSDPGNADAWSMPAGSLWQRRTSCAAAPPVSSGRPHCIKYPQAIALLVERVEDDAFALNESFPKEFGDLLAACASCTCDERGTADRDDGQRNALGQPSAHLIRKVGRNVVEPLGWKTRPFRSWDWCHDAWCCKGLGCPGSRRA